MNATGPTVLTPSPPASRTGEASGAPPRRSPRARPRILIVTDAWRPQINGVARTYEWLAAEAPHVGVDLDFLTPDGFRTFAVPTYQSLRLALPAPGAVGRRIEQVDPDAVHIATEGPLGHLARGHCLRVGRKFTTCYHTRFPEYLAARWPLPLSWSYAALRRFHNASAATMVSTPSLSAELAARGFERLVPWRRGVPTADFESTTKRYDWPAPVFLFVGRVAVEKNIDAFLALDLPGSKVVVGEGPAREQLQRAFPAAIFTGRLEEADLVAAYATADAFVFPSLTDTFGLVLLEAMIAGAPVAAFPVAGPRDVVGDSGCGALDWDLRAAALRALEIPRDRCRAFGLRHTMRASAEHFVDNVARAVGAWSPARAE